MANRRGPGRPFKPKPGPKIEPKDYIDLPKDFIETTFLREILNSEDYKVFLELPQKVKDTYITNLRRSLLTATSEASSTKIVYGEDEFGDAAGVQVTLSLDPADWKDPGAQAKKTLQNIVKNIFDQQDITREFEKRALTRVMSMGEDERKTFGAKQILKDAQILDSREYTTRGGSDVTAQGAAGIGGRVDYFDYANTVRAFIDASQSIKARGPAIEEVKNKFYETLEKEVYYATVGSQSGQRWLKGNPGWRDKLKRDLEIAYGLDQLEGSLDLSDPSDKAIHDLLFASSQKVQGKFGSAFIKLKNGETYSLEDMFSLANTPNSGGRAAIKGDNSFARRKFLERAMFMGVDAPDSNLYLQDMFLFLKQNYKEVGFSSPEAVEYLFASVSGSLSVDKALQIVLEPAVFQPFSGKLKNSPVKPKDVVLLRGIFGDYKFQINSAKRSLDDAQHQLVNLNYNKYFEQMAKSLPESEREGFLQRTNAAAKYLRYAEVRGNAIAIDEFVTAIKSGSVFNFYFFLGKYNDALPSKLQDIKRTIDNIKIAPRTTVGDLESFATGIKNRVLEKVGLASPNPNMAYAKRGLNPLKMERGVYLYQQEFLKQDSYDLTYISAEGGSLGGKTVQIELFGGDTFNNLKEVNETYKNTNLFRALKLPRLQVFAKDFKGLGTAYEGMERMLDYWGDVTNGDLNVMHEFFEDMYLQWEATGSMDFLDYGAASFLSSNGQSATPEELEAYKKSFGDVFKKLQEFKEDGLDSKDFFSLLVYLKQDKAFLLGKGVLNGARAAYTLGRYGPLLNVVSGRLSALQSKIFIYTEVKLLERTFFKVPGVRSFYNFFLKPGVSAYERGETLMGGLNSFFTKTRMSALFSKIASSPIGKVFKYFGKFAFPSRIISLATLGTSYMVYAAAKAATAMYQSFKAFIRGRMEEAGAIIRGLYDDIIVVPLKFFLKIVYWYCLGQLAFIILIIYFILSAFTPINREIPNEITGYIPTNISYDAQGNPCTTDFGDNPAIPQEFVDLLNQEVLEGNFGEVTSCPGFRTIFGEDNFHAGIDYSATSGTSIVNPFNQPMTVSKTATFPTYGNTVSLETEINGEKYYIFYAHLTRATVKPGQVIQPGEQIALSGNSGSFTTGAHIHFEIRVGGDNRAYAQNPCTVLNCPSKCKFNDLYSQETCGTLQ